MVVVPEPSVKSSGAFVAVAVDRAVCPASEHRSDETFGFAVGLRATRAGAEVSNSKRAARDRVNRGAISGSVVGEELLDSDPVPGVERDRALEERNDGDGVLVTKDFRVGESAAVIDRDMDVFPADLQPVNAV